MIEGLRREWREYRSAHPTMRPLFAYVVFWLALDLWRAEVRKNWDIMVVILGIFAAYAVLVYGIYR